MAKAFLHEKSPKLHIFALVHQFLDLLSENHAEMAELPCISN